MGDGLTGQGGRFREADRDRLTQKEGPEKDI